MKLSNKSYIKKFIIIITNLLFLFYSIIILYSSFGFYSNNHISLFIAILILSILLGTFWYGIKKTKVKNYIILIFGKMYKYRKYIILVYLFLQYILIHYLTHEIGWDPGFLVNFTETKDTNIPRFIWYFSKNPNNFLIVIIFKFWNFIREILHLTFIPVHEWLNLIMTLLFDFSLMIFYKGVKVSHSKNIAFLTVLILGLVLGLSPAILVTYSDFPAISISMILYWLLVRKTSNTTSNSNYKSIINIINISILIWILFAIKPSSIIFIIAYAIYYLLAFKLDIKKILVIVFILISTFTIFNFSSNKIYDNYVTTNKEMNKSLWHYLDLGVTGVGTYNEESDRIEEKYPKYEDKVVAVKKDILKKYKKIGIFGYPKFIINKFSYANKYDLFTLDFGGLGREKKQKFIDESDSKITKILGQAFLSAGKFWWIYMIIIQFFWQLVLISILVIGLGRKFKNLFWYKMSFVGSMIYLTLFEYGRNRYLIQFFWLFILFFVIQISLHFKSNNK